MQGPLTARTEAKGASFGIMALFQSSEHESSCPRVHYEDSGSSWDRDIDVNQLGWRVRQIILTVERKVLIRPGVLVTWTNWLQTGITMSISSKKYHEHLNACELSCAKIWGTGVERAGGWKGVPRKRVICHEVSWSSLTVPVDILTALLKCNSHTITIHLFKVYNLMVFSIFRVVQLPYKSSFRTFSSPHKETQ